MSGESRGARWVRRRGAAVGPRVSRRWKAQGPWGGCGGGGSRRPRDAKWRNSIYISNPSCNVLPLTPLIFSLSDSFILSISLSLSLSLFFFSFFRFSSWGEFSTYQRERKRVWISPTPEAQHNHPSETIRPTSPPLLFNQHHHHHQPTPLLATTLNLSPSSYAHSLASLSPLQLATPLLSLFLNTKAKILLIRIFLELLPGQWSQRVGNGEVGGGSAFVRI